MGIDTLIMDASCKMNRKPVRQTSEQEHFKGKLGQHLQTIFLFFYMSLIHDSHGL